MAITADAGYHSEVTLQKVADQNLDAYVADTMCRKRVSTDFSTDSLDLMKDSDQVMSLLAQAKQLARQYYRLTGKPLGITGEVAEYEAARILGVTLTPARQAGYDATEIMKGKTRTLQIKGRCLPNGCTPGQRLGSIQPNKEWDAVLMVLLDAEFNATEIWEADRTPILAALAVPGSRARNENNRFQPTVPLHGPAAEPGR